MKKLLYILLTIYAVAFCSCKAKGGKINPLDTNSFDSVAVGNPLVVDTDIVGVTDTSTSQSSPYDKADSMIEKDVDTTTIDTGATPLP